MSHSTRPFIEQHNQIDVLNLIALSDRWGSDQIERHRTELLEASRHVPAGSHLLVDLTGVTFFGSAFIELLLQMWNNIKQKADAKMGLCGATDYCVDIIVITKLDTIWPIYKDRSEGLAELPC